MRKWLFLCWSLLLAATASGAWADGVSRKGKIAAEPPGHSWALPVAPPTTTTDWNGLYTGFHAGAGDFNGDSFDLGGQVGYNFHWKSGLVLGLEVDASKVWFRDFGDKTSSEVDFSGSVRARVGWATGSLLLYGTAGVGVQSLVLTEEVYKTLVRDREFASSLVAGLGAELATGEKTTVRLEWLHWGGTEVFDLGADPVERDVIRIGANLKF